MEGKVVIMSAVLVSLLVVLGQVQVEARICCPTTATQTIYNGCRRAGGTRIVCASVAGCRIAATCPRTNDILKLTGQIQGKAAYTMEDNVVPKSCCPNATARSRFDICLATEPACARIAGCILVHPSLPCPPRWTHDVLENTVNEYCKSGCLSSVCGAITTLQNSDASEVVNGAVEKCTDACSAFCTKKASITTAVETS